MSKDDQIAQLQGQVNELQDQVNRFKLRADAAEKNELLCRRQLDEYMLAEIQTRRAQADRA